METMRARLEDERDDAIGKLQHIRASGEIAGADALADEIVDDAGKAQASLRQHLEVVTYERLVERISRITEALQRLREGSYGTCELTLRRHVAV
jgi:RNA polymerase-binding transcription factor DksA